MAWAPIAAAGIQAGGSLLGGMLGASGQAATNAQQFAQSEMMFDQQQTANEHFLNEQAGYQQHFLDQQQAYGLQVSNTAWQRGVEDMKMAGINPILAANLGGASTPTSGSASVGLPSVSGSAPPLGNPGTSLGAGVASAAQAGKVMADVSAVLAQADKDKSATTLNEKQGGFTDAAADAKAAEAGLTRATTDKAKQETANSAKAYELIQAQTRAADASAADSMSSAAYNAARSEIAKHDANSAYYNSVVRRAEAWDRTNVGPGFFGDLASTINRATDTAGKATGSWFGDLFGSNIDHMRSGDRNVPPAGKAPR